MAIQIFSFRFIVIIVILLAISSTATLYLSKQATSASSNNDNVIIDQALEYSLDGKHTDAFKLLFPLAEQNNPRAKLYVGVAYYHGNGVKRDYKRSRDIFFYLQRLEYEPHIVSTYLNLIGSLPISLNSDS